MELRIKTDDEAKAQLGASSFEEHPVLYNLGRYLHWEPGRQASLDGKFDVLDLEAIVYWVRKYDNRNP